MSDKPINTLSGDQWLKLVEAEKAKLLEINLASDIGSFPKGKTFFQDVLEFFQYEAFSDMVKKWNALRKECLEHAFYKILYPMFRVEIRNKLTREAKGKQYMILYKISAVCLHFIPFSRRSDHVLPISFVRLVENWQI